MMNKKSCRAAVVIVAGSASMLSCKTRNFGSANKAVTIPATTVKDQGMVGFCWSYAAMGILEGQYKKETGQDLDLSEEYLGFWKIAELLAFVSQINEPNRSQTITERIKFLLEQNSATLEGSSFVEQGKKSYPFMLQALIQKYGVMPQAAFTRKFNNDQTTQNQYWIEILQRWNQSISARTTPMTPQEIATEILAGSAMFPKAPPHSFQLKGTSMTAQQFYQTLNLPLHEHVGFITRSRTDYDHLIQGIKLTLAKGQGAFLIVPFTSSMNTAAGVFGTGAGWENTLSQGGHAMIAVDYRNKGGTLGRSMSPEAETDKHPRELEEIVVKNSWGSRILTAETTINFPPVAGVAGFFSINQGFLLSVSDSHFKGIHFGAMLPEDTLRPPLNPY
jgi:hypothetical protein